MDVDIPVNKRRKTKRSKGKHQDEDDNGNSDKGEDTEQDDQLQQVQECYMRITLYHLNARSQRRDNIPRSIAQYVVVCCSHRGLVSKVSAWPRSKSPRSWKARKIQTQAIDRPLEDHDSRSHHNKRDLTDSNINYRLCSVHTSRNQMILNLPAH